MTARNLQDRVKKSGLPWSAAKGFDTFTPIGLVSDPLSFFFLLLLYEMVFNISQLLSDSGDVILIDLGTLQILHPQGRNQGCARFEALAQGT